MTFDPATRARLAGLFVAEADEALTTLTRSAAELFERPAGPALAEFGRVAHGLKGAASSLGYDGLARALHDLEEQSLGLRGDAPSAALARQARIARALDLLGEGVARMAAGGSDAFPADVVRSLLEALGSRLEEPEPAAGPRPAEPRSEGRGDAAERLNVPASDVDDALRLAASLARSAAQLHEALGADERLGPPAHGLADAARGLEGLIAALRLVPADLALSGLEDEVADLADHLRKRCEASVSGKEVRADRRTLQSARGLVRHLVRNALDHGIEAPEARRAAGKPETGRVAVRIEAGDSALRVAVSDDGAGFDVPAIRAELARRRGDADAIAVRSEEEVLHLWAIEGGSTRGEATQISGRGLGLSAVAAVARAAGGGIRIRSARGAGSEIQVTLPLDVYAVDVLTVVAGGRALAVPLAAVERTVHLAAAGDAVHEGPTGRTLAVGETILPLARLADALGVGAAAPDRFAVVVHAENGTVALAVEDVGAIAGVVPVTVPGVAQADALATGLARLGDGAVISILNPRLLLPRAREVRAAPRAQRVTPPASAASARGPLEVVLAEDSLATREVLRVLLEEQGFRVRLAGDGDEALARVAERLPDVVVTDVNMPRRDGLALARALRQRPESARLPIVLLTSRDDDASRAAGADAGADAYLVKSRFNAGVLRDTLARLGVSAP